MRFILASLAATVLMAAPLQASGDFDWNSWRDLPVQNGGRLKPLDTLAWETLRLISNQTSLFDPQTNQRLNPQAAYFSMLFDWQGWDNKASVRLLSADDWNTAHYYELHKADQWDEAPLLRVDNLELRAALGLESDQKYVAPAALRKASVFDPRTKQNLPFSTWANRLALLQEKEASFTELEKKGLELGNRLWTYQSLRMGRGLQLLPVKGDREAPWTSLAELMLGKFNDTSDPSGQSRQAQKLLLRARAAYRDHDVDAFNAVAGELKSVLREFGEGLGEYPGQATIRLEVAYNYWAPFRFGWVLMLTAALCMLFSLITSPHPTLSPSRGEGRVRGFWRLFSISAWALYACGLAAMIAGFWLRMAISGRAPVSNMYESVVFVGFGVPVFGMIFELIFRRKYIFTAAATVSFVTLLLADCCPDILDPSLRPLQPVLRSNFWLALHVITIMLSYAAFALAMGIANITLGYFLVASSNGSVISALNRVTYRVLQVGVLLLAAGTILGGVWADYAWGRFWGWDPKEVWALIALLGYLCVLHARFAGWVGQRGLPALAVSCFALVIMAWYGVNFVLGAGLHSYGFGGGGQFWVYGAVLLELLYTGLAVLRTSFAPASSPLSPLAGGEGKGVRVFQTRIASPTSEDTQIVGNAQMSKAIKTAEKILPS